MNNKEIIKGKIAKLRARNELVDKAINHLRKYKV